MGSSKPPKGKGQEEYNTIAAPKSAQVMGASLSSREKAMSVMLCMMACWARKNELDLHTRKGQILSPDDEADRITLNIWWERIGVEKQLRIKKCAFESSLSMNELTKFFQ